MDTADSRWLLNAEGRSAVGIELHRGSYRCQTSPPLAPYPSCPPGLAAIFSRDFLFAGITPPTELRFLNSLYEAARERGRCLIGKLPTAIRSVFRVFFGLEQRTLSRLAEIQLGLFFSVDFCWRASDQPFAI